MLFMHAILALFALFMLFYKIIVIHVLQEYLASGVLTVYDRF